MSRLWVFDIDFDSVELDYRREGGAWEGIHAPSSLQRPQECLNRPNLILWLYSPLDSSNIYRRSNCEVYVPPVTSPYTLPRPTIRRNKSI